MAPSLNPTSISTVVSVSTPSFVPSAFPTTDPTVAPSVLPTNTPIAQSSDEPSSTTRLVADNRPSTVPSSSSVKPPSSIFKAIAPTQTAARLQFTQSLTLSVSSGCSGLNADSKSQTALELTTAQSLQVPSSDVTYAGCTFGTAIKAVEIDLLTQSVSANMNVHIPLSRFAAVASPSNTSSVVNLFTKLQQKLVTSVQSGDFTKQLTSTSKNLNANVTSKAVVSKTTTSGMAIQNPPTVAPIAVVSSFQPAVNNDRMHMIIGIASGMPLLLIVNSSQVLPFNTPAFSSAIGAKGERYHSEDEVIGDYSNYS
eukprot:gene39309-53141_t